MLPAAPKAALILLPTKPGAGARELLGLSLGERAEKAARRAGFGPVVVVGPLGPSWSGFEPGAALVLAPDTLLAEKDGLARLADAEPDSWASAPGRLAVVAANAVPDAVAALAAEGGAPDFAGAERRLAARFGPPVPLPSGVDPMLVESDADVPAAERRLMRALVKDTDGFMARHVERPISLAISRRLAATAVTPNQMSLISIAVGICAGPFFLSGRPLIQTIGALMFLAHSILDGCDGELARLKFQESRWGGVLDFWGDNVVHAVVFGCMSVGWSLSAGAGWPLLFGAAAVLGSLGAAGFVYWRLMRGKTGAGALFTSVSAAPDRPLARVLDAASRRDFIYLVLLLALFGRSNLFVALAGIGAPVYLAFVLALAATEARQAPGADARGSPQHRP